MVRRYRLMALFALLVGSVALAGCTEPPVESSSAPAADSITVTESAAAHTHADADHTHDADVHDAFAELPEGDREAAIAQKICPVSGEALDAMGTPIKLTVSDREVFVCCASCKDKILADPATYLAKLDSQ